MIDVSPALKDAFNPNDGRGQRSVDWRLRFEVVNNEALAQITPTAEEDVLSRIAQTIDGNDQAVKIATCEHNSFILDGTCTLPPEPDEQPDMQIGLIMPVLSDSNGDYPEPQIYTASMVNQFNLIAITIDWGHFIPRSFVVEWHRDGQIIETFSVSDNTESLNLINVPVEGVDRIVVKVLKSALPYRKARIAEFIPGAIKIYTGENADSVQVQEIADPTNERVTANDMKVVAENFAREFNIFSPDGIYRYFQERQQLLLWIGALQGDGQYGYVDMGKYYLKAPALKGNLSKLELKAVNLLGVLQDTQYGKGVYRTGTVESFALEIANDAGVNISYPTRFSTITAAAYFATMSHAQAFRMIAQATNTILYVDRNDVITFAELELDVLQTIGEEDYRMENGFAPSDDDIYNTVNVEFANLAPEGTVTELAKMPVSGSLVSTDFYADNAIITTAAAAYNVKYAPSIDQTAQVTGGELIISGKKIINSAGTLSVTTKQSNEPAYIYEIKDNPFIQAVNAGSVAEYMLAMKAMRRRTVKVEYRGYPYFEIGDIIDFNTGSSNTQPFFIMRNKLNLGGGMTGTLEARER